MAMRMVSRQGLAREAPRCLRQARFAHVQAHMVADEKGSPAKVDEFRQHLGQGRSLGNGLGRDAMDEGADLGRGDARPDQSRKPAARLDAQSAHAHRANGHRATGAGRKAGPARVEDGIDILGQGAGSDQIPALVVIDLQSGRTGRTGRTGCAQSPSPRSYEIQPKNLGQHRVQGRGHAKGLAQGPLFQG